MRRVIRVGVIVLVLNAALAAVVLVLRRLIPSVGDEESDEIALAAVAGGRDLRSRARAFRGGSARAIMGGLNLDLRDATLDPAGGRLELQAIMGGIDVLVPATWRLRVTPPRTILGGADLPRPAEDADDGRPALELAVQAVFGGVEVRVQPRTGEPARAPEGARG
jgi:hypothetical protein